MNREGPHSPKKRTVSIKVKKNKQEHQNHQFGIKACPDFDSSATSLGKDTDLDTTSEQADDQSYADEFDNEAIVAIESDDEDDTEFQSGGEDDSSSSEEEQHQPVAVVQEAVVAKMKVPAKEPHFEDESFPAPPKKEAPRRQVRRNISFEGNDGRVVMCTADRRKTPRRYASLNVGSPARRYQPQPAAQEAPARLVPKPLPAHVVDDDDEEGKKIAWEKPEWAKSPVLKPTRKVGINSKKIGWQKPDWAKKDDEEDD